MIISKKLIMTTFCMLSISFITQAYDEQKCAHAVKSVRTFIDTLRKENTPETDKLANQLNYTIKDVHTGTDRILILGDIINNDTWSTKEKVFIVSDIFSR